MKSLRSPVAALCVVACAAFLSGCITSKEPKFPVSSAVALFGDGGKFKVLDHDFTIEGGELTPTMKVRRSRVIDKNRELISELYLGKDID